MERHGSPLDRALVHVSGAHTRGPQPHRQPSRDAGQLSAVRSRRAVRGPDRHRQHQRSIITSISRISPRRPRTGAATRICARMGRKRLGTLAAQRRFLHCPADGTGPTSPTPVEDDRTQQMERGDPLSLQRRHGDFKWLVGYFYQDFESQWNLFVPTPDRRRPLARETASRSTSRQTILQNSFFGELSYTLLQSTDGDGGRAPLLLSRHGKYRGVGMAELLRQR